MSRARIGVHWALLLLAVLTLAPQLSRAETRIALGPMLGHVSATEARVWIKAEGAGRLGLRIGDRVIEGPALEEGSAFMGHVLADELEPDTEYTYQVLLDGEPAKSAYPSTGKFRTTPKPGTPGHTRIAFSSCFGRVGEQNREARQYVAELKGIDLMLELGDNHYADSTDPEKQRAAYLSHRGTPEWHAYARAHPILGIWDDHDYGPNDSDRTAEGKEKSLRTFREHWANPSYGQPENPGIYCRFPLGEIEIFFLDDRYHRDPNKAPADGKKTVLGAAQKAWIKKALTESKAKVKIIALGSETQLNGHSDSYTSFPAEQKEMLDFYKEIEGTILISGDRHFTGGYHIRGETVEITAGPMGSKNFPRDKPYPEMFLNHGAGKLLAVLDIDTSADPPAISVEVHRVGEGMIEEKALPWDAINGKEPIPLLKQK